MNEVNAALSKSVWKAVPRSASAESRLKHAKSSQDQHPTLEIIVEPKHRLPLPRRNRFLAGQAPAHRVDLE